MSYTGRKRYRSRRERYERSGRHLRAFFIFAVIAIIVLLYKNRYDIISWLKTYFM